VAQGFYLLLLGVFFSSMLPCLPDCHCALHSSGTPLGSLGSICMERVYSCLFCKNHTGILPFPDVHSSDFETQHPFTGFHVSPRCQNSCGE
jgi:hypothetical protein